MKESFILEIIRTIGTVISPVVVLIVGAMINKKINANTKITEEIKVQTDGIKDELVAKTKELGEAIGKAQGRAEIRQENKALGAAEPAKVEVVNFPVEEPKKEPEKVEVVNLPLEVKPVDSKKE